MPARKTPLGIKQKHYNALEVMEIFGVCRSKAYEIIHQCAPYGEVARLGRTLRVSETALQRWYAVHVIAEDPDEDILRASFNEAEIALTRARRGRPRKGVGNYAERYR